MFSDFVVEYCAGQMLSTKRAGGRMEHTSFWSVLVVLFNTLVPNGNLIDINNNNRETAIEIIKKVNSNKICSALFTQRSQNA